MPRYRMGQPSSDGLDWHDAPTGARRTSRCSEWGYAPPLMGNTFGRAGTARTRTTAGPVGGLFGVR